MSNSPSPVLLISGASGQLGRRVVHHVLAHVPAAQVIAGSRSPDKLKDLPTGVATRAVDFNRPETLAAAFKGVDRLLIISTDSLDKPRVPQHEAAITAAKKAGVSHVVYTSTVAAPSSTLAVGPDHFGTEEALARSGLGYTVLRNNYYADNLIPGLQHALKSGQWYNAAGQGRLSFVTREDCALAAAAALASGFDGRRVLDITGPAALSYAEVASLVAQVAGRPLTHIPVDEAAVIGGLTQAGLPAGLARAIATFDTATAKGELAVVSSSFTDLTGRPATPLATFLTQIRSVLLA